MQSPCQLVNNDLFFFLNVMNKLIWFPEKKIFILLHSIVKPQLIPVKTNSTTGTWSKHSTHDALTTFFTRNFLQKEMFISYLCNMCKVIRCDNNRITSTSRLYCYNVVHFVDSVSFKCYCCACCFMYLYNLCYW
jgi:hypothetical protein